MKPVCEGRKCRRGVELCPLGLHLGGLAALGLGELGRDHDQAQVDHEERTDLQAER